jgi:Dolichyl-phosphate-mannose-protein mannosyltransferase
LRTKLHEHTCPPDRVPQGSLRIRFLHLAFANTWEIYLILLVAGFLCFYQVDTSEFDDDQAILFRLAHDAVYHGLLPITSNTASISIAHPPGVIYLFMLPAALSANPLWGVVFVGIFNLIAVLLTYLFTRRYYGRLAGTVGAFLYVTALKPLTYGRFIWQPNLMPPFVVLFVFALFWGVVERRKGWLFPALLLLGILYQMHETAILLFVPLLVAVVLAPGTIRWRDLAFAFVLLLIIFSPYLLWEFSTKFADLLTLYRLEGHGRLYLEGIGYYLFFISSYGTPPENMHSVVRMLAPLLSWLGVVMPLLAAGGFVTAGWVMMWTPYQAAPAPPGRPQGIALRIASTLRLGWGFVRRWWTTLRATPYRCGLLLLLVWQIIPLLLLLLHKIGLTWHYFLILMPGPFILIGLFVSILVGLHPSGGMSRRDGSRVERGGNPCGRPRWLRYGTYVLLSLVIVAQIVNCTAAIVDTASGNFSDRDFPPYPYHNDLRSLQHALNEADQLAQQRHLSRVYITTDAATQTALRYLAEQMQTPTTLFDATKCLVLPNPAIGPAVLLVGPYDGLTNALLSQFASATLIDQPARLGGPPFRLYVVTPNAGQGASHDGFVQNLQLLDGRAQHLNLDNSAWLVTHWSFMRSEQTRFRTTYNYALTVLPNGDSEQIRQSVCTFTSMREGDELLVAFDLPVGGSVPTSVTIEAQSFVTIPNNPVYGPLHAETNNSLNSARVTLQTTDGEDSITVVAK